MDKKTIKLWGEYTEEINAENDAIWERHSKFEKELIDSSKAQYEKKLSAWNRGREIWEGRIEAWNSRSWLGKLGTERPEMPYNYSSWLKPRDYSYLCWSLPIFIPITWERFMDWCVRKGEKINDQKNNT